VSDREQFMMQLTACQNRVYGYLLSLVADRDLAEDLLQQTNLVLWRKADTYEPGTNFISWAFRIAYYEVLAHREQFKRDRHVFSEHVIDLISESAHELDASTEDRVRALSDCVKELPPHHAEIVRLRYADGQSVKEISLTLGRTVSAVKSIAHRIRKALLECIERRIAAGQAG
jgi:RNA polymerase sigma-70 factor (ECF subfamily)